MEAISKFPYTHQPLRSISFPTRVNPSSQRIESLLNNLKPHHQHPLSSNNYSEAEKIHSDLVDLAEIYNCMEEFFNSQQTKQSLLHYQDGKLISDSLCYSVTLLDACECSRDLLLVLREHIQTLQSAIRRRRKGDSSIENSVSCYENFRKKTKKKISNQLMQMKKMQNKVNSFSLCDQDQQLVFLVRVLREVNTITISILSSVLLFLSMPTIETKGSSLISKLKPMMLFSSEKEVKNKNEIKDLNKALCSLIGREKNSDYSISEGQRALRLLETLNINIDSLEGGLDCIFRCLVKHRVLFLNMLAH
ncbi:uncharacterized protein LOC123905633 [Trifolium pratense]|uniref:uncharacterized protein LOC123905633 n=1 Tax=Trifolium pratense TaxID=57577 RepID=UPI001E697834|nr:uncharacterized protein LOC123905633 [Trifolium pratense]